MNKKKRFALTSRKGSTVEYFLHLLLQVHISKHFSLKHLLQIILYLLLYIRAKVFGGSNCYRGYFDLLKSLPHDILRL
jgi:hypothetical protein